jgi:hypothetical protein
MKLVELGTLGTHVFVKKKTIVILWWVTIWVTTLIAQLQWLINRAMKWLGAQLVEKS